MITMKARGLFLDSPRVIRAISRTKRRIFAQSGAYVRTTARRSMKKARRMRLSEMPAEMRERYQPKRDRQGRFKKNAKKKRVRDRPLASSRPGEPPRTREGLIKKLLFFSWDPSTESVVIGPERRGTTAAPWVLEFGGVGKVRKWGARRRVWRRVKVAPRPFMRPALRKELPRLPRRWHNSIRG